MNPAAIATTDPKTELRSKLEMGNGNIDSDGVISCNFATDEEINNSEIGVRLSRLKKGDSLEDVEAVLGTPSEPYKQMLIESNVTSGRWSNKVNNSISNSFEIVALFKDKVLTGIVFKWTKEAQGVTANCKWNLIEIN